MRDVIVEMPAIPSNIVKSQGCGLGPLPGKHTVHWFRRGLRLHDNPALREGLRGATTFRCIFIVDPWFAGSSNVGINKWRFLLQCLEDLDQSLRRLNSRLFVIRGQPADALPKLFREWGTTELSFEEDPEPFGRVRDLNIAAMCREIDITVVSRVSHTLYKLDKIIDMNGGRAPLTYQQFQSVVAILGAPALAEAPMTAAHIGGAITPLQTDHDDKYGVPTLEELGFETEGLHPAVWLGGESEALARLEKHLERKAWVASFGRPKMTPQSLLASETGLSPYLRFGCLSTRLFYSELTELYRRLKRARPPLSLHGQLLWREFFYTAATKNPNFDRMLGNPICVQIPWDKDKEALAKWANGQTGYPWIDAIMTQLREEGWIHHLARHAVACFLTRGDLWISWEEGMKVFEELLLDADWSVNAGMWMWLSCSSFFQQFFHCYCPVRFGKKADPNGDYIRKYIPALKDFPTPYIHAPWLAPLSVQTAAGCVLGRDYPLPMVDHAAASKNNILRIKQVYNKLSKFKPADVLAVSNENRSNLNNPSPRSNIVASSVNYTTNRESEDKNEQNNQHQKENQYEKENQNISFQQSVENQNDNYQNVEEVKMNQNNEENFNCNEEIIQSNCESNRDVFERLNNKENVEHREHNLKNNYEQQVGNLNDIYNKNKDIYQQQESNMNKNYDEQNSNQEKYQNEKEKQFYQMDNQNCDNFYVEQKQNDVLNEGQNYEEANAKGNECFNEFNETELFNDSKANKQPYKKDDEMYDITYKDADTNENYNNCTVDVSNYKNVDENYQKSVTQMPSTQMPSYASNTYQSEAYNNIINTMENYNQYGYTGTSQSKPVDQEGCFTKPETRDFEAKNDAFKNDVSRDFVYGRDRKSYEASKTLNASVGIKFDRRNECRRKSESDSTDEYQNEAKQACSSSTNNLNKDFLCRGQSFESVRQSFSGYGNGMSFGEMMKQGTTDEDDSDAVQMQGCSRPVSAQPMERFGQEIHECSQAEEKARFQQGKTVIMQGCSRPDS